MESKGSYGAKLRIKPQSLCAQPDWVAPGSEEIREALKKAGWNGEEFSRILGVEGRTVRRWTLGEKSIGYASWCVLCVQAGFGQIWNNKIVSDDS